MNLVEMVNEELIAFDFEVSDKEDAIRKVGAMMFEAGLVNDKERYIEGVFHRETEFATGIGNGIAIPHCKDNCVVKAGFTLVRLTKSIEWGSLDDKPVNFIIMLAAPDAGDNTHLKVLSTLAMNLMDDDFRSGLLNASSVEEIKKLFESKGE